MFFISTKEHGVGGHHFSLDNISKEIGKIYDARIITIGPRRSKILESNKYFLDHIYFTGVNIFSFYIKIKKHITEFNPDIYHIFDVVSYNILRLLIDSRKNIIILNKCGGRNHKSFPKVKNIVLFSRENLEWLSSSSEYSDSNLYLIPNRVSKIEIDTNKPIPKKTEDFNFLRISRIGKRYEKSFLDSINLLEKLIDQGITKVRLIIIGVVEDQEVFKRIKNHKLYRKGYIKIYTDIDITKNASKMLYLADAVIGIGRGFMEASSLGLPLLAINSRGDLPVLIDENNLDDVLKTNFSLRNTFTDYDEIKNLEFIKMIIHDNDKYQLLSEFSKKSYLEYFSIEEVAEKYQEVYKNADFSERFIFKDILHIIESWGRFIQNYYFFLKSDK